VTAASSQDRNFTSLQFPKIMLHLQH